MTAANETITALTMDPTRTDIDWGAHQVTLPDGTEHQIIPPWTDLIAQAYGVGDPAGAIAYRDKSAMIYEDGHGWHETEIPSLAFHVVTSNGYGEPEVILTADHPDGESVEIDREPMDRSLHTWAVQTLAAGYALAPEWDRMNTTDYGAVIPAGPHP